MGTPEELAHPNRSTTHIEVSNVHGLERPKAKDARLLKKDSNGVPETVLTPEYMADLQARLKRTEERSSHSRGRAQKIGHQESECQERANATVAAMEEFE